MKAHWELFSFTKLTILQIDFDFKQVNGPLCSQNFYRNWNSLKKITQHLADMISNKEVKLSVAGLPSEGKSIIYSKSSKAVSILVIVETKDSSLTI